MKTIEINLYSFNELSDEAKENAISEWYKNEDYPLLSEDLTESLYSLLEENGVTHDKINLFYSLSYCQGDGLCFTGSLTKNLITLELTHSSRYYYASSVTMTFYNNTGEEIDEGRDTKELSDIYFKLCKELEKQGYEILEYRMTNEEFQELCEANDYTFLGNGKMKNG